MIVVSCVVLTIIIGVFARRRVTEGFTIARVLLRRSFRKMHYVCDTAELSKDSEGHEWKSLLEGIHVD